MKKKYIQPKVVDFYLMTSSDVLSISLTTADDGEYVEWPGNKI